MESQRPFLELVNRLKQPQTLMDDLSAVFSRKAQCLSYCRKKGGLWDSLLQGRHLISGSLCISQLTKHCLFLFTLGVCTTPSMAKWNQEIMGDIAPWTGHSVSFTNFLIVIDVMRKGSRRIILDIHCVLSSLQAPHLLVFSVILCHASFIDEKAEGICNQNS